MAEIRNLRGETMDIPPPTTDDCIEEMVKSLVEDKTEVQDLILLGMTKDQVFFIESSPLTLHEVIGYLEMAKLRAMLTDCDW